MQISLGFPDPRDKSSLPVLKRVQAGVARAAASKTSSSRIRLPITAQVMAGIQQKLTTDNIPEAKLIWAVACTAFFGFFRLGELLPSSLSEAKSCVQWEDIAVDNRVKPKMFRIFLKKSKTDQFGKGAHIILGSTDKQVCPVSSLTSYLASRPSSPGPLFINAEGSPITKPRFVNHIRDILRTLGLPQDQFAGHSFRIGAATTAAYKGVQDSTIKTLGRWQSSAFLQYIRMPQSDLAAISRTLVD